MKLSTHSALIYMMVVTASADRALSDQELDRMSVLVERLPVFEGFNTNDLPNAASDCAAIMGELGIEAVLDLIVSSLDTRLHDTAYALAVEIAAVDLELEQEELRWLEMVRDQLQVDRLTTAAIEVAARARLRKA